MSDQQANDSIYDNDRFVATTVENKEHRAVVGGLWEEIGALQFQFLKQHGLRPRDHLLDVGCGCLRGGLHFAAYLEPGHYWGIDSNKSLLDAGYNIELPKAGLIERVPRQNLVHDSEFNFARFGRHFDIAIAQSLFTHLSINRIRLCFAQLAKVIRPGGRFFATYFEISEDHAIDQPFTHSEGGVQTSSYKDPFHYRMSELEDFIIKLPLRLLWTGNWGHPRGQKMAIFDRLSSLHGKGFGA